MMNQPRDTHHFSTDHHFSVGILHIDLRLHGCKSLKEKRGRLARVMNHLRKKHAVVVAEVGDQQIWGRAGLAAVTLSTSEPLVTRLLEAVAETLGNEREVELVWYDIELV